ncbi:MAG: 16S rRNA (adenine(1518)-N(6)/adenine(1519)-N(6))-dimethyltransferase RsmA [Clostridiales Family XIII bacterium]|jgi:16S rRNA (adenine1518-N6/adenine1519-N6)-dimethyltransferase|nr:16S rRNA (adenine(1518)-N(6)/adenine(1519)-N(6))-dimethyltransferase RsmA [Clostridiales Family XIII bacterium]
MISKNDLLYGLKRYNIVPNKKFGQNFLFDKNILEKIIQSAKINENDCVIEIGSGPGLLTVLLAKKCKKITAVEKDKKIIPLLMENIKDYDNIKIYNKDFFDFNFDDIEEEVKIIGNLPYSIASKIILDLFKKNLKIKDMTFLIQKELAERLIAKKRTKDYGSLTMITDFLTSKKEIIFNVSENVFIPIPKVKSSLMKIYPKTLSKKELDILPVLEKLLLFSYSMRRKKIKTSFSIFFQECIKKDFSKDKLEKLFEIVNIDGNKRIEEFEVDTIANFIIKYMV